MPLIDNTKLVQGILSHLGEEYRYSQYQDNVYLIWVYISDSDYLKSIKTPMVYRRCLITVQEQLGSGQVLLTLGNNEDEEDKVFEFCNPKIIEDMASAIGNYMSAATVVDIPLVATNTANLLNFTAANPETHNV